MEHLLAERVKDVMEAFGYAPSSFADTIDVPRPIISHILSGRNKPSLDVIQKILMRFPELNPWWLLTGTGQMKQLNLFTDQELESLSVQPTSVQQANTASQPVKATAQELKTSPPLKEPIVAAPAPSSSVSVEQEKKELKEPSESIQTFSKGKTVEKMIVFYTDKTFSVYHPE